jgi:hypothetical protein
MDKSTTLPLLEALDYLYENNLTIDRLWTVDKLRDPAKATRYFRRETHISVKPQPSAPPEIDLPPKPE